jgi:polyisoprenoid-binding protein YceI
MKKTVTYIFALTTVLLTACGGNSNNTESQNTEANNNEAKETIACFYSYNPANTTLKWEAFKTTDRVAVGGTFNSINVKTAIDSSSKIKEVIESIKFAIPTNTVNSNNEGRDEKIAKIFFGSMKGGDLILGQVKELQGDDKQGKASFYITLNEVEKEVMFDYTIDDATVKMQGSINLEDFMATDAVNALNKECFDLHKGKDGVSKLWPDVSISFETTFNKYCH